MFWCGIVVADLPMHHAGCGVGFPPAVTFIPADPAQQAVSCVCRGID